jgi:hypothetical protein
MSPIRATTEGIVGIMGSYLCVISTFQEQLDYFIRTSASFVGLITAIIILYRLVKK